MFVILGIKWIVSHCKSETPKAVKQLLARFDYISERVFFGLNTKQTHSERREDDQEMANRVNRGGMHVLGHPDRFSLPGTRESAPTAGEGKEEGAGGPGGPGVAGGAGGAGGVHAKLRATNSQRIFSEHTRRGSTGGPKVASRKELLKMIERARRDLIQVDKDDEEQAAVIDINIDGAVDDDEERGEEGGEGSEGGSEVDGEDMAEAQRTEKEEAKGGTACAGRRRGKGGRAGGKRRLGRTTKYSKVVWATVWHGASAVDHDILKIQGERTKSRRRRMRQKEAAAKRELAEAKAEAKAHLAALKATIKAERDLERSKQRQKREEYVGKEGRGERGERGERCHLYTGII